MDIPLGSLKYILNAANTDPSDPRYEPYGIIVSKMFAYEHGCRPVLYLSESERKSLKIPEEELWRVVTLEGMDGSSINWVHEREWRSKHSFKLPVSLRSVLVKDTNDAKKLQELIASEAKDLVTIPASIIPLTVLCQGLPYLSKPTE